VLFCFVFQKFLETEDENEEYRKVVEDKIENMESSARMLELKNKNASDHCTCTKPLM